MELQDEVSTKLGQHYFDHLRHHGNLKWVCPTLMLHTYRDSAFGNNVNLVFNIYLLFLNLRIHIRLRKIEWKVGHSASRSVLPVAPCTSYNSFNTPFGLQQQSYLLCFRSTNNYKCVRFTSQIMLLTSRYPCSL